MTLGHITCKYLLAVLGIVAISCTKINSPENIVYINASVVNTEETKTVMDETDGLTVYWSPNQELGLTTGEAYNYTAKGTNSTAEQTTKFTCNALPEGTWFAYCPKRTQNFDTGFGVNIPSTQNPTMTSFDPDADVLLSQSIAIKSGTKAVTAYFKRLTAVVKIVFKKDENCEYDFSSDYIKEVYIQDNGFVLAGLNYFDSKTSPTGFASPYTAATHVVTAKYKEGEEFELNGTNAVYLCVLPNILSGSTKTIFCATTVNGATIKKSVGTYSRNFELVANGVTTFNITVTDGMITKPK